MITKNNIPLKPDFEKGKTILIDKEINWTSFDVVNKIKSALKIKKVGHAGTLDPLASGLLIVCTGKMTKSIHKYQDMPKTYTGSMFLGATTPSYDLETETDQTFDISGITPEMIRSAALEFTGEILQKPPAYSAVKHQGKRLYSKARKGIIPDDIKEKKVIVYEFEIIAINLPEITFKVVCSKGTYIRSLVYDLAKTLNNGAYLLNLRRTGIGYFNVNDAFLVNDLIDYYKKVDSNL